MKGGEKNMAKTSVLTKKDEQEIQESLKDSEKDPINVDPSTNGQMALAPVEPAADRSLTIHGKGIDIEGLEDIPMSIMTIPFVRLVQPTSTNIEVDGKDAAPGTFYFNDLQTAEEELEFVMLRAKQSMVQFERDGVMQPPQPRIYILGITRNTGKLFIFSLSVTSFSNFGKYIAKLKNDNIDKVWRFALIAKSQKKENSKGKYYVADFDLSEEITDKELEKYEQKAMEYGLVLDRADEVEAES